MRQDVVAGRMAGLERADSLSGFGDDDSAMFYPDVRIAELGDRRPREIPHIALAGSDRIALRSHAAGRFVYGRAQRSDFASIFIASAGNGASNR